MGTTMHNKNKGCKIEKIVICRRLKAWRIHARAHVVGRARTKPQVTCDRHTFWSELRDIDYRQATLWCKSTFTGASRTITFYFFKGVILRIFMIFFETNGQKSMLKLQC